MLFSASLNNKTLEVLYEHTVYVHRVSLFDNLVANTDINTEMTLDGCPSKIKHRMYHKVKTNEYFETEVSLVTLKWM
jgi:hypothetical protein